MPRPFQRPTFRSRFFGPGLQALSAALFLALLLSACSEEEKRLYQGYVEGEFVHVASPLGGRLDSLAVIRGDRVEEKALLFALDDDKEQAAVDQARDEVERARNQVTNLEKGKRPSEIEAIEAQLRKAASALRLSKLEYERRKKLVAEGTISEEDYDRARTEYQRNLQQVRQIRAELETARLGAREDEIKAARSEMRAAEASLAQARWNLDQKSQTAPRSGLIFDTIYYEGEYVPASRPVISLLPPENVRIRFFVPEEEIARIRLGQIVDVNADGLNATIPTKVSFISPEAEYTPPVIYSTQTRSKLVFMVESSPSIKDSIRLHPGQPVDARPRFGDKAARPSEG